MVNQRVADELGLTDIRIRISKNFQFLTEHPVLNSTIFIHDDQEFVKNKLQTAEALISIENTGKNIENFLELFNKQLEVIKVDFDDLLKVSNTDKESIDIIVSRNNFLREPIDGADEKQFVIEQRVITLVHRIKHEVVSLIDVAKHFHSLYEAVNKIIPTFLDDALKQVKEELVSFRRIRNIADNAKTENIYDQAVIKYRGLETDYRWYFYWAIGITVGLSLLGLFSKNWLVANYLGNIEFWVLKVSILAVGITLITYFLKQSSHYQRLADQNYQTQVELQAYPSFMESIPTEEAASVRKELALKYFGREIDGAAHKDMSNLISDQMKSTTEMVKAATDVLKAKG